MWTKFKNIESGIVHAVSFPGGMTCHGFALNWPLLNTNEPLTCNMCLQFAYRWREQDAGLDALLPAKLKGQGGSTPMDGLRSSVESTVNEQMN